MDISLASNNAPAAPIAPKSAKVFIVADVVRLSDVFDVDTLPPADRTTAAALPVAVFRPGQSSITIDVQRLVERVRGQMPWLGPWLQDAPKESVEVKRDRRLVQTSDSHESCLRANRPLAEGDTPARSDFSVTDCLDVSSKPALHFSRSVHVVETTRSIADKEIIGGIQPELLPDISPGQRLVLRARINAVLIERSVIALQPARAGAPLFVQAADREVFAARGPEAPQ